MTLNRINNIFKISVITVFIALIAVSPSFHFIPYLEFHDCQRVIQLLLLILVMLEGITVSFQKNQLISIPYKIRLGLTAFVGLATTSIVLSIEPRYATIEVTIFVALFYLAIFIARLQLEERERFSQKFVYMLWIGILLYMVSFYTGYLTAALSKTKLIWPFPFYGFSNIRLFQQYQLWSLSLICLPLISSDIEKNFRVALYFAITLWWVLLYYAASRGVILAWIAAMLLTAIFYKRLAWPFLRVQTINAITGLIVYLILFKINTITSVTTSTIFRDMVTDRTDLWRVSIGIIKDFPLFGIGPMHFYFYNTLGTHPHNSALQIASEWGLLATLLILVIVGYSLNRWWKKFNAKELINLSIYDKNLAITLFFAIVANGAYSLVEGVIIMPLSQVLMFTTIGLMIGQYFANTNHKIKIELIKTKFIMNSIFACLTAGLLAISTSPELVRGLTSYKRILYPNERAFSLGPNTINPRIWMQQKREK